MRGRSRIPPLCLLVLALFTSVGCQTAALSPTPGAVTPLPSPAVPTASPSPLPPSVRLVNRAKEAGLRYRWTIPGPRPLTIGQVMGNGCAFLDYDGDDNLDILLVGSQVALYKGDGKGHFTDVSKETGIGALKGDFLGCAVGDYDNDGFTDIYLSGKGTGILLHNERGRRFRNVTAAMGLKPQPFGTSALFFDADGDGRLDLFFCNYVAFGPHTKPQFCERGPKKLPTSCPPREYKGLKGVFYRNTGKGFADTTATLGLDHQATAALGVGWARCGPDGEPCLYVANDEKPGDLFVPSGKGWRNVAAESGVARDTAGSVHAGMGVDWGDFDNDGHDDLLVTTFSYEIKNLYRNNGDSTFTDVSERTGLQKPVAPYVSFGTKFADFDNDGYLDVLLTSGHVRDNAEAVTEGKARPETYRQPAQLLMNQGGTRFVEVPLNLPLIVGRGLAVGDYDNDGRVDALVVDSEGSPLLLHNETPNAGHYLDVRLVGMRSNRDALGAVVTGVLPDGRRLRRLCQTGGSYLSASAPTVHFGLGDSVSVATLIVQWPTGTYQEFPGSPADRRITLREK